MKWGKIMFKKSSTAYIISISDNGPDSNFFAYPNN